MSEMNERKIVRITECADGTEMSSTEKYTVNKENMEKFNRVFRFFCVLAEEDGGEVACFEVEENPESAGVYVEVSMLDLYKESIAQFIDILELIDVFDVETTESDSLLISAIVHHVYGRPVNE